MRRSFALALLLGVAPYLGGAQESAAPMVHGAEIRVSAKKWQDAQRFLEEEAIPAFPENAELHYWLGVVYAQGENRDTEKAAAAFARANELADPEDAELKAKIDSAVQAIWGPLVNQAAKALEAGDLKKSEMLLQQATAIRPDGPEAYINLGTVYLRQERPAEAAQAYEKALELQPENETLLYNLGITYHQLGRAATAAGDSAQAEEHLDRAEATYKAYLAKKPDDVDIINNLAALYQERGQEDAMRATLGTVAAADSAGAEDHFNAGVAFLKNKEYAQAEDRFRQAIALAEQDASDPAQAEVLDFSLESLGLVLIQQKDYEEAISVLERLLERAPENATAHEYIGFAYRDAGRREEASAAFAKAEELKKAQGGGGQGGAEGAAAE